MWTARPNNHDVSKFRCRRNSIIESGVLWWLFDAKSGARRGQPPDQRLHFVEARPPVIFRPFKTDPRECDRISYPLTTPKSDMCLTTPDLLS